MMYFLQNNSVSSRDQSSCNFLAILVTYISKKNLSFDELFFFENKQQ